MTKAKSDHKSKKTKKSNEMRKGKGTIPEAPDPRGDDGGKGYGGIPNRDLKKNLGGCG